MALEQTGGVGVGLAMSKEEDLGLGLQGGVPLILNVYHEGAKTRRGTADFADYADYKREFFPNLRNLRNLRFLPLYFFVSSWLRGSLNDHAWLRSFSRSVKKSG